MAVVGGTGTERTNSIKCRGHLIGNLDGQSDRFTALASIRGKGVYCCCRVVDRRAPGTLDAVERGCRQVSNGGTGTERANSTTCQSYPLCLLDGLRVWFTALASIRGKGVYCCCRVVDRRAPGTLDAVERGCRQVSNGGTGTERANSTTSGVYLLGLLDGLWVWFTALASIRGKGVYCCCRVVD